MPGITNKTLSGYFETEYSSDWPGLVTNLPSSRIPPGACFSCNAAVVRGRLQNQPGIFPVTGTGGLSVTIPTFSYGENICVFAELQVPGSQQGFTVIITNVGVYTDFASPKTFSQIFSFPTSYPRYASFGAKIIGNVLYFSSSAQRGVYALTPTFSVASVEVINPGGYFTSTPTVVFSDGGGTGATATAVLSSTNLSAVNVTAGGSGYVAPPLVSLNGGATVPLAAGTQLATAVGILSTTPLSYVVREVTALTGVIAINVTAVGSGYTNPTVVIIGGGGTGAAAAALSNIPAGSGITGINVESFGTGYTSVPTVEIVDPNGTGATATATLIQGKPFIGGDFMASMNERLLLGNIIGGDGDTTFSVDNLILTDQGTGYTSAPAVNFQGGGGTGATALTGESGGLVTSILLTEGGLGYYQTPTVLIDTTPGGTGYFNATAIAQLSPIPLAASSDTKYPDRIAYSAPNAYGFFDPNYGTAPGGYATLPEARGLICSVNVVESVAFVGHNGGITEMTPNTSSAAVPFGFYPIWSADQGVIVRYGSMAQYGSTLAFLSEDSSYTMTPNGLTEIGGNIASLLSNVGIWNNGSYPLQGLYGSIVEIEGQKHYLIALSSDDWDYQHGNNYRQTIVYDFNMSEGSWHEWSYPGVTCTCPIYQSFDQAIYAGANSSQEIAKDSWLLFSNSTSGMTPPADSPVFLMNPTNFDLSIPFGYVIHGQTYTWVLPIYNTGGANLTISAATITTLTGNAGDFVLNGFSGTITIAPNGVNRTLSVSFTPTSAYETLESATLSFTTNAGTKNFTLKGTCVNGGTVLGPYTPTPSNTNVTASQTTPGSTTNHSVPMSFSPESVTAGATVVVATTINASVSTSSGASPGETATTNFEYSTDGGSTYNVFYSVQAPPNTFISATPSVSISSLLNLSNLLLRVTCIPDCPSYEQSAYCAGTIEAASASIVENGDVFCQIIETDSLSNEVPPALQYGTVSPGNTYVSNLITLTNPTSVPVTVTVSADTANGYSIINATGSTTLAPSNGSQYTFNVQLTNPSPGSHNDTSAVVVTIPSQVGAIQIDAWYGTQSNEMATVTELAPVKRALQLLDLSVSGTQYPLAYQFRSEAPSIARMQQERRVLVEYENETGLNQLSINPVLTLTYTGQQDPTTQTGTVSQQQTSSVTLNQLGTNVVPGQVLTAQADFGTFTGVCTTLGIAASEPVSLVRLTQIGDIPKAQVP